MLLTNTISALLVLSSAVTFVTSKKKVDYCSKDICPKRDHVRCGNDGSFGPKCPKKAQVITITDELKRLILKTHNDLRKDISAGNYKGLESAKRMIELEWNDELAENALYNAKTCVYAHDNCRNTKIYKNVGQNIAMYMTRAVGPINYKSVVNGILASWLRQAKNINMKLIEQFRSDSGGKVNNFAQMIRASCSQIGCAIVHFSSNGKKSVFFVCNYSSANIPKEPIYEVGPACSACATGCSFTSPGLCNTEEEKHLLKLKLKLLGLVKLKLKL
ncbi:Antigen 5 like allergen Cul n 1 [Pseudolycoriella hygida]|uniref:Antigen 5 like allergen Cul n 1 n=1 Tax=Pseudolycoriella hygida TaxID=35572 RepID=A0A9Q0N6R1_9DIPT|nr:Antigen 5 like allergen Cul n 1 [Pseudolycoriella hygida]